MDSIEKTTPNLYGRYPIFKAGYRPYFVIFLESLRNSWSLIFSSFLTDRQDKQCHKRSQSYNYQRRNQYTANTGGSCVFGNIISCKDFITLCCLCYQISFCCKQFLNRYSIFGSFRNCNLSFSVVSVAVTVRV